MTRKEQKEENRKKIILAGLDLFVCKGVQATKITDIAQAVGMSSGLMFHYFNSKEDLFFELVEIGLDKSNMKFDVAYTSAIGFFEEMTRAILQGIDKDDYTAKMFVFMAQASNEELLSEEIRHKIKWRNINFTEEIILKGQSEGSLREGNATALSVAFWSAIIGVCKSALIDKEMPRPETEWLVDIIRAR